MFTSEANENLEKNLLNEERSKSCNLGLEPTEHLSNEHNPPTCQGKSQITHT